MPNKTRIACLHAVEQAFLTAEAAAETSAHDTSICVAEMYRARGAGKFRHDTAYEAFDLISEAAHLSSQARQRLVKAHDILAAVPEGLGIFGFGADKHDTPNMPFFLDQQPVVRSVVNG